MTVIEVEAKKISLEAELNTAAEATKVLTPVTPEFDEAYSRYLAAKTALAKIPEEISKAKIAENAEAIAQCGGQVAEAIGQLVTGLKVEELIGTPVTSLRYFIDADKKASVVFNPVVKVATRGTGSRKDGKGGRTVIVDSEGNRQSLTKFVLEHATEAEKGTDAYKYPHTRVDSKPKFEEFCKEHTLTGYTYEVATAEAETSTAEAPTS